MKAIFVIQGEGRGHLTQALALKDISTCTVADVSEIGCCSSPRSPSVGIINKCAYIISDNFAIIA